MLLSVEVALPSASWPSTVLPVPEVAAVEVETMLAPAPIPTNVLKVVEVAESTVSGPIMYTLYWSIEIFSA